MKFSIINTLSALIVFQLILLVLFLVISRKGKQLSNRILGIFFLLITINIGDGLLLYYGFYREYPSLAHLEDGFIFIMGPALYFYTRSMVFKDFKFLNKDWLHLLPFALVTLSYLIYYHSQPRDFQEFIQTSIAEQTLPPGFYFSVLIVYAHLVTYLTYSFLEVKRYRLRIKNQFSSIHKINLNWLTFMLGSVAVIMLISLITTFLPVVGVKVNLDTLIILAFVFLFFFTSTIVWKGLNHPQLFSGIEIANVKTEKYKTSTLTGEEKRVILQQLEFIIKSTKPYLDADLTVDQLSEKVNTTSKRLSQVINQSFQQNFFDYINSFRIEEACKIIQESRDPKLTILEVMYQCGFNSKSSFNTLFKRKTGKTPGEYKAHLISSRSTSGK